MRIASINLNISAHHRAKGQRYGAKVELGAKDLPMSLLYAIRNMELQWRVFWGGPTSVDTPVLRVLWGWAPADGWAPGYAYVRHEYNGASRVKFTLSRSAIRRQTGQDMVPTGRWSGQLTCEPDEDTPLQVALLVRPNVYIPRDPSPRKLVAPAVGTNLPRLGLP